MSKDAKFIKTPITSVFKDAVSAIKNIPFGIESYSLCDYLMQSIFIKATGFQEQKLKCISWDLATEDYEYRRELSDNKMPGYSTYKEKNIIFRILYKSIEKIDSSFELGSFLSCKIGKSSFRQELFRISKEEIEEIFEGSILSINLFKQFQAALNTSSKDYESQLLKESNNEYVLFQTIMQEKYDTLYKQRNRIAHNTPSYQQNLPSLNELKVKGEEKNYFYWFMILNMIDKIFIYLYEHYHEVLDQTW